MKVIGMFLIILGHLFPSGLVPFIYSFSVPLFFIVSGFLTNTNYDTKKYFIRLVKGLVVPYALIWGANTLIYAIIARSIPDDLPEKLMGFVFGLESYIGALWFVYTLLLCKIIVLVLSRITKSESQFISFLTAFSLICILGMYLLNHCDQNSLIEPFSKYWPTLKVMFKGRIAWGMTNVLCAMPFFTVGIILRETNSLLKIVEKVSEYRPISILSVSFVSLIALYPLAELNGEMYMYDCGYGNNLILCYLNALIGTFSILLICICLQNYLQKLIALMATGSIIVLGFHGIPLNIAMFKFSFITTIGGEIIGTIAFALILYVAFVPVIKFIKRYASIMLGR